MDLVAILGNAEAILGYCRVRDWAPRVRGITHPVKGVRRVGPEGIRIEDG